jgi:hypothetical protein
MPRGDLYLNYCPRCMQVPSVCSMCACSRGNNNASGRTYGYWASAAACGAELKQTCFKQPVESALHTSPQFHFQNLSMI